MSRAMETGKFYHMHVCVEGFLRRHPKPVKKIAMWFSHDDGRQMTPDEVWHIFQKARLEGRTGIPLRGCDNFDPKTGECLGHEDNRVKP